MSYHCSLSAISAPSGGKRGKFPYWLIKKLQDLEQPQLWSSVDQMVRELRPPPGEWRLCRIYVGSSRGLPSTHGKIIAKGGVHCLILTDSKKLIVGITQSFLIDEWD